MNEKYPSEIKNPYERLEVNENSTYEEIKKSYRAKALYWHPDKNPKRRERAHFEFIAVSEAFEVLSKKIDKNKDQLKYSSEAERGTYDYYSDIFYKIFHDESFNYKMSSELKDIIKMFKMFM